jgi:hypothetical protein
MNKKRVLDELNKSIGELSELIPNAPEMEDLHDGVEELNQINNQTQEVRSHREDSIAKSHISEDKEANALTMQIKIDGTALKGQTAVQAFETFSQLSVEGDELLDNLAGIVQKNPPQANEKIGQYFIRLANEDLIEIDDTIDHFINLFNT